MNVLLVNSRDIKGGAAVATYRLLNGLNKLNVDTKLFVNEHIIEDPNIIYLKDNFKNKLIRKTLGIKNKFHAKANSINSSGYFDSGLSNNIGVISVLNKFDIVHLNWFLGFIDFRDLQKVKKPIVWTLHDSWAFTGGCNVPLNCNKYINNCGCCPILNSKKNDFSSKLIALKEKHWSDLEIALVTPSNWLKNCALQSHLFRNKNITVIPNGLDLTIFKPIPKQTAREIFNLPKNKKIILLIANNILTDANKGYDTAINSIKLLENSLLKEVILIVVGGHKKNIELDNRFEIIFMKSIHDELLMSILYGCCDMVIVPSKLESFSQVSSEALACGKPVVAFNGSGPSDIIDHRLNGYLAESYDISDFAEGIKWVLTNDSLWGMFSKNARNKAEKEYDILNVTQKYINLYRNII